MVSRVVYFDGDVVIVLRPAFLLEYAARRAKPDQIIALLVLQHAIEPKVQIVPILVREPASLRGEIGESLLPDMEEDVPSSKDTWLSNSV